jgi:hypothetical protein
MKAYSGQQNGSHLWPDLWGKGVYKHNRINRIQVSDGRKQGVGGGGNSTCSERELAFLKKITLNVDENSVLPHFAVFNLGLILTHEIRILSPNV